MTTVPSGWRDDGTTLTAPNGLTVGTGFRGYILANAWDPANEPVAAEEHVAQVEICNTAHGAGDIQYFRYAQLSWTQQDGVWLTRIGQEAQALRTQLDAAGANLQAAQQQRDALQAQLATAQANITSMQAHMNALANQSQQDQQTIAQLQQQLAAAQQAQPTAQEQAALLVVKAIKAALAAS